MSKPLVRVPFAKPMGAVGVLSHVAPIILVLIRWRVWAVEVVHSNASVHDGGRAGGGAIRPSPFVAWLGRDVDYQKPNWPLCDRSKKSVFEK